MAEKEDGAEKSHEPSQRRLDEARKKGEIARAPDLQTGAAYLGLFLLMLSVGGGILLTIGADLKPFLDHPDVMLGGTFDGTHKLFFLLYPELAVTALPILAVPGFFVLLLLFATRGITVSATKLQPKFSRINPIENAKNKFGRKGLFEFFKSFVKLMVYSILLGVLLRSELDTVVGSVTGTPMQVMIVMFHLLIKFLGIVVVIALVIGGIDFFFQQAEHIRKNRMTHKEVRDEHKESEGDPHLKQHRRMRAQELALNQQLVDVPTADVIIVNPTHYAVALKWSRLPGSAPICVAKGKDMVAARIRKIATENGVPIHSDPPTARAVYATTEIGAQISYDQYRQVAAAIRFADRMRAKARKGSFG